MRAPSRMDRLPVVLLLVACQHAPVSLAVQREKAAREAAAAHEAAARDAEAAQRPREALQHYLAAIQAQPEGFTTQKDFELRAAAVRIALALEPPALVLDEAQHGFDRAEVLAKSARDDAGWRAALDEYERGLRQAPWEAQANFNAGLLSELLKDWASALRGLKLYLMAAPAAPDKREVGRKIAELEIKVERSGPRRLAGNFKLHFDRSQKLLPCGEPVWSHWEQGQHWRMELRGEELHLFQHIDSDCTFRSEVAGQERLVFRLRLDGRRLTGMTVADETAVDGTASDDGDQFELRYNDTQEVLHYRRWAPDMPDE